MVERIAKSGYNKRIEAISALIIFGNQILNQILN